MVEQSTIEEAVRRLLAAAPAGSRVILFGSYARGDADDRSDVDFLVVEPAVADPFAESVRLRHELNGLRVAVDVVIVSAAEFEYWKETPNTLPYEVTREGKVYDRVA